MRLRLQLNITKGRFEETTSSESSKKKLKPGVEKGGTEKSSFESLALIPMATR